MTARSHFSFSHLGLYVQDLAKMEDFYTRVLGLTVTDRGSLPFNQSTVNIVFLSGNPDEHHQIALANGRPPDVTVSVINQVSLRANNLDTLKNTLATLRKEGQTYIDPVTHGNALSIYTHDPEKNRLELFIDLPWYVTQPKRDPFDFSGSNEEIMARAEKHARAQAGFVSRQVWRAEMARRMGVE